MTVHHPSRRRLLQAGARGTAAVLLGAPAVAACTDRHTAPGPDPLDAVARLAAADAQLAVEISDTHPSLAAAAVAVAADRRAHAEAVRTELRRVSPTPAASSSAATPSSRPPLVPTDSADARRELDSALRAGQDQAAALVGAAPGHRAGLLASIAACCASHRAVLP